MSDKDSTDGARAEQLAADFLQGRGLRLLARNYRVKGGEVDLVCRDGGVLVFVEVRLRRNARYGSALESITRQKQARVVLAARHYLASDGADSACRFDCIAFDRLEPEALQWVRDAFTPEV